MSQISGVNSAAFSQDQFLQLLVTQLQNQDPLDPVSDREFIGQLTQLNTLSSLETLNTGIENLNASFASTLKLQQLSEGANLIGKNIEFPPAEGTTANRFGAVTSVTVENGNYVLRVGQTSVALDDVISVR